MDKELSEQLKTLRDAITEAMWNSEHVRDAIHALLYRSGTDVQIEINLVVLDVESAVELRPADDAAAKLILNPTDSLFLHTLNISDL